MVFQHYALFPHMTVSGNVAFGLKIKKVREAEPSRARARDAAGRARRGSRGPRPGAALRRPAAARGAGPRPREPAGGRCCSTSRWRARRQAPQADADRAQVDPADQTRHDLRLRHPRSGGGAHDVRPDRDHEPRPLLAGGTPREIYERPATRSWPDSSDRQPDRAPRRPPRPPTSDDGPRRRTSASWRARRSAPRVGDATATSPCGPSGSRSRPARSATAPRHVRGTVVDVVYLGSVTQLIVLLPTGERLTVHQLNDEIGADEPRPGSP